MSFSLRSMFNKNEPKGSGAVTATSLPASLDLSLPVPQPPDSAMSPSGPSSSPSPFGASLFRTLGNDDSGGAPLGFDQGQSPFQSPSAANAPLTVADVLPQIPPEMARATSIPQDQPVQISPQLLNHALSSGQLAVPLFEIYRVCPGIFQTPVSPDNTRMVSLPPAKLPALISAAMPVEAPAAAVAPASPFASLFSAAPPSPPAASASPFQSLLTPESPAASPVTFVPESPAVPSAGTTILPPRRPPSQPPASSLPPSPFLDAPSPAAAGVSPFAQMAPAPSAGAPPALFGEAAASPFAAVPAPLPEAPPSLFGEAAASPFATAPAPAPEAPPSPFGAAAAAPFGASPFGAVPAPVPEAPPPLFSEAPASPFATAPAPAAQEAPPSLFGEAAASPFASPPAPAAAPASPFVFSAPAAPAPPVPAPQSPQAFPASTPADMGAGQGKISGPATASVGALLQGQHADSLGFDPAMVPSWISTQFNGGVVAELQDMPEPSLELGVIIDGITDIGFRNVLNSARRSHVVKVPLNLLSPAQPAAPLTPASASEPVPVMTTAAAPMMVTPAAPPAEAAPPTPPAGFITPVAPAEMATPFAAAPQPAAMPPAQEPAPPLFKVEPGNPFASVPDAPPPAPAQTPVPAPEPPPQAEVPSPFAAPTLLQPNISLQDLFSASKPPSEPKAEQAAELAPPPAPAPVPPPASSAFAFTSKAFDPFAPAEGAPAATGGFSSFDLLGGSQAASEPELQAATPPPPAPEPFRPEPVLETPPVPKPAPAEAEVPHFFIEPEPEVLSEPAIVPEIPMTLEIPETPIPAPRASTWPDIDPIPTPPPAPAAARPASPPLFVEKEKSAPVSVAPVLDFSPPEKIAPSPAMPTLAPSPRGVAPAAKPSLGLSAMERSGEEQLLLRALLDTDEELSLERVIEMTSQLPGISACALVRGSEVVAGSSTKGSDAKAFRAQAAEVAKSLRTLAPLIGITDAETFTLNTDSRLITLCFPGEVTLAILHDREPTLGLRDKLTLIARQLDSMFSKG